jgi:probable F420-dependent oxidoreductase
MTASPLTEQFGVKLGIRIPYRGGGVTPERIVEVAQAAEVAGFESGWVGDHIVWPVMDRAELSPVGSGTPYPHTIDDLQLEPMTVLTYVAARTARIKLGTAVMIAALRAPLFLAKQAASFDFLFPGRLILGVATGWLRQEFSALGVPFHDRGQRLEESVEILRLCWTQGHPSFSGRFWSFGPLHFCPQPARPIPIWFGGHVDRARQRAARQGDGWIQASLGSQDLRPVVEQLQAWRPEGMAPLEICVQYVHEDRTRSLRGEIQRLADAGADTVLLRPGYEDESPARLMELIDMLR